MKVMLEEEVNGFRFVLFWQFQLLYCCIRLECIRFGLYRDIDIGSYLSNSSSTRTAIHIIVTI